MKEENKGQDQCTIQNASCRFVLKLKYKLADSYCYYKYTVGDSKVWTGDIKLAKKFKYRIVAYVYLLFIDCKDSVVFKTYN